MRTYTSSVSRRGQVTIPAEVRQHLGLQPGDRIEFLVGADSVWLRPAEFTLDTAFGSVTPLSMPEDFEVLARIAKEARVAP